MEFIFSISYLVPIGYINFQVENCPEAEYQPLRLLSLPKHMCAHTSAHARTRKARSLLNFPINAADNFKTKPNQALPFNSDK